MSRWDWVVLAAQVLIVLLALAITQDPYYKALIK
jgi:hypothetical protein